MATFQNFVITRQLRLELCINNRPRRTTESLKLMVRQDSSCDAQTAMHGEDLISSESLEFDDSAVVSRRSDQGVENLLSL